MKLSAVYYPLVFFSVVFLAACQGAAQPTLEAPVPTQGIPEQLLPPDRSASGALLPVDPVPFQGIEIKGIEDLPNAGAANAQWVRYNGLFWSQVEPEEGSRDWAQAANLEGVVQGLSAQNQEVILIVRGTPTWAQAVPESVCGPILPEKLPAFAAFLSEAVSRYSQPPYNVKYWELGNEPDVDPAAIRPNAPFGCWGNPADENFGGGYYAEMLKLAYPQIKAADPEAQILVGGLLLDCDPLNPPETEPDSGVLKDCRSSRFLQGILENGGGDYFDGISFHAYDYYQGSMGSYSNINWHSSWDTTGPVFKAKLDYLRAVLSSFGYPDKYLMNTETALLCGRDGTEPVCQTEEFARTKANYLAAANSAALAERLRANIWYSLQGWRGSGLLGADGQPNQAFRSFQFNREMLSGVVNVIEVQDYPGVKAFEFLTEDIRIWVMWSADGSIRELQFAQQPSAIFNVLGEEHAPGMSLTITPEPVYVVWPLG